MLYLFTWIRSIWGIEFRTRGKKIQQERKKAKAAVNSPRPYYYSETLRSNNVEDAVGAAKY